MRSEMCLVAGLAIVAVPSVATAGGPAVVSVGSGQTLTESDLAAGSFNGQSFPLNVNTVINVNEGGVIGPAGAFPDGFNFNGTTVNINSGGFFASTDPDPSADFVQTNATNINLNLFDGGGFGENFFVFGGSSVNVFGGEVSGNLALFSGVTANVSGGKVGSLFTAFAGSEINISGGEVVSDLVGADFSRINISGGVVGDIITTFDSSVTNISGGSIGEEFVAFEGAEVNLFVRSLRIDGEDVDLSLGDRFLIEQRSGSLLEAILEDGSFLDFSLNGDFVSGADVFEFGTTLTATLVPSPSAAIVFVVGVVAGRRRRG
ncbi:MAG: hypothetical protein AAGG07_01095 [Planctomycetota bacterium]